MLYFLAVWSILSVLTWLIGIALLHALKATCFDRLSDRITIALWLGTVVLADGLLAISLAVPLSAIVGLMVALSVGCLLLSWPPVRTEIRHIGHAISLPIILSIFCCALFIAVYMTQRVTWFDTGLYYFGAIRWLSEFGAVPGLALLLNNFGFTSSWFALVAPFSMEAIAPRISAVTNGFILFIATWQGLCALWYWIKGEARVADKFIVLFLGLVLPTLTLTTFLSAVLVSPSPDIAVIFLTGIVAWSLLTIANVPQTPPHASRSHPWDASLIPVLLAAGAVAIKLSALPLLPIAWLFYGRSRSLNLRRWLSRLLIGGCVAFILLTPLMTVSVVTSGCPLYPSAALCLDVPWRLSAEQAQQASELIRGWDRWFVDPPAGVNPLLWRIWQWLKLAHLNLVMLGMLLMSVLLMGFTLKSAREQKIVAIPWLFGLGCLGMLFILLRAPLIRFGLGYFVVIPAIALVILGTSHLAQLNQRLAQRLSASISPHRLSRIGWVGLGAIGVIGLTQADIQKRFLLPPAMPMAKVEIKQSYDVEYVSPINEQGQCWAAPIPCAPGEKNIRLRDPTHGLEAGFIPVFETSE